MVMHRVLKKYLNFFQNKAECCADYENPGRQNLTSL